MKVVGGRAYYGEAIGIAGPAVIISFAVGSLIAATIALAMGEMASRHPVRGGHGEDDFLHIIRIIYGCCWLTDRETDGNALMMLHGF